MMHSSSMGLSEETFRLYRLGLSKLFVKRNFIATVYILTSGRNC